MDFVDITDSAFSLGSSATNNVIGSANEIISNQINLIADTISETTIPVPDVVSDVVSNIVPDIAPDVIPDIGSLHIDDDNYIFIYIGIGVLVVLAGVFAFNYYNKNKRVRFNEVSNEVCYPDSNVGYCRRSEF